MTFREVALYYKKRLVDYALKQLESSYEFDLHRLTTSTKGSNIKTVFTNFICGCVRKILLLLKVSELSVCSEMGLKATEMYHLSR